MESTVPTIVNTGAIEISPITLDKEYANKWNENHKDFVMISRNGQPIRETLYRVGGMCKPNLTKGSYFMLLKYFEATYQERTVGSTKTKTKRHLDCVYVIVDWEGNEVKVFKRGDSPYLKGNLPFYSDSRGFYHAVTGYCYGDNHGILETENYFIVTPSLYDEKGFCGNSEKCVYQVSKSDGTFIKIK